MDKEFELELRQHLWVQLSLEQFKNLKGVDGLELDIVELTALGLSYEVNADTVELHVDILPVEQRDAIVDVVNGRKLGGRRSVRFPVGAKPIIKVGQDETVFKMYAMHKKRR